MFLRVRIALYILLLLKDHSRKMIFGTFPVIQEKKQGSAQTTIKSILLGILI